MTIYHAPRMLAKYKEEVLTRILEINEELNYLDSTENEANARKKTPGSRDPHQVFLCPGGCPEDKN